MQYFKGDDEEQKFDNSGEPILSSLSSAKDDFYAGAYSAAPLGDVMFDSLRSPLANAISREVYRISFSEIFDAFVEVGTFESYITVFEKIFGENVIVEFTVPAAGKLQISIDASDTELSNFVARSIVNNDYVYDNMVDYEDDQIVFQTIQGLQSEYELEQMLFEMVPGGIYTEITLNLG